MRTYLYENNSKKKSGILIALLDYIQQRLALNFRI